MFLSQWIEVAKKSSRERFLVAQPDPMLLFNPPDLTAERTFRTVVGGVEPTARQKSFTVMPETVCVAVKKRTESPYSDRISVGRTSNSDIYLAYANVSKLHAFFSWTPDRSQLMLTDAGSTNGTFIDGERISPRRPEVLTSDVFINFWFLGFRFVMPEAFYALATNRG